MLNAPFFNVGADGADQCQSHFCFAVSFLFHREPGSVYVRVRPEGRAAAVNACIIFDAS